MSPASLQAQSACPLSWIALLYAALLAQALEVVCARIRRSISSDIRQDSQKICEAEEGLHTCPTLSLSKLEVLSFDSTSGLGEFRFCCRRNRRRVRFMAVGSGAAGVFAEERRAMIRAFIDVVCLAGVWGERDI